MCGRYANYTTKEELESHFSVQSDKDEWFIPNYNIAPTTSNLVCLTPKPGKRGIGRLRWGLIPSWSKTSKTTYNLFNARSETLLEKPSYRTSFKRKRCIVPASGFYEWNQNSKGKEPVFVQLSKESIMSMAGLYDVWRSKDGSEMIWSFTIITTEANSLLSPYHHRMPVILQQHQYDDWLNPENDQLDELNDWLIPYPSELMTLFEVDKKVNSVRHNEPSNVMKSK